MEKFVTEGNEAVSFKLVRTVKDLESTEGCFHPEMCHQIFGEGETIFGYENLKVQIYVAAGSLKPHVSINYKRKISSKDSDGVEADDLMEKLKKVLPPTSQQYVHNLDMFSAELPEEKSFRPYGELIHSFKKENLISHEHQNGNGSVHSNGNGNSPTERTFEIFTCDISTPKFADYLSRMELFLMWYIDAATFVDPDDEKWKFFIMYEKYKNEDGNNSYAFVGYTSVYNFYVYPENIRPKVAQMLLLPPFQKQGLGVELLSAIYQKYRSDPKVVDIGVEDPSDDCEALRDYVDALSCMKLESYNKDKLKNGFSKEMEDEANKSLKMNKRQARRIYEILRLRITNEQDQDDMKNFRLDVKSRLNIPFKRQEADIKRIMRKSKVSAELRKADMMDDATRKEQLECGFQTVLTHYNNILRRIEKYSST